LEDGNLYFRLRTMLHTIYAAKFEQTIIHQHVHLRWESQWIFVNIIRQPMFFISSQRRGIKFTNIHQPMLKLQAHSGFHDLFLNYILDVLYSCCMVKRPVIPPWPF
jgi:hypothetical protein